MPMLYTDSTLRASAPGLQAWTPLPQGRCRVAFPPVRKFWNLIPSLVHTERQGRDLNRTTSLPLWALVLAAASSGPTGRGRFHGPAWIWVEPPVWFCNWEDASVDVCHLQTYPRGSHVACWAAPSRFVRPQRIPGGGATASAKTARGWGGTCQEHTDGLSARSTPFFCQASEILRWIVQQWRRRWAPNSAHLGFFLRVQLTSQVQQNGLKDTLFSPFIERGQVDT